jgi:hypothetical protein
MENCVYERIAAVEFAGIKEDLGELRDRVEKLENVAAKAVALLVANLVGVVMMLLGEVVG